MNAKELLELADTIDEQAHAQSAKLRALARELSPSADECFAEARRHLSHVERRSGRKVVRADDGAPFDERGVLRPRS